jgi:DNA-binding beta-propeller fold protein YncE
LAVNSEALWVAEYYVGVHRVDPQRGKIIGKPIDVKRFPSDIAASGHDVWVIGSTKWVDRVDARRGQVHTTIPLSATPSAVAVGERYVWVASYKEGSLTRVDPGTNRQVGRPILVGGGPNHVDFYQGTVWVTDFDGGRILRLDESTGETVAEIPGGRGLSGIATTSEAIWVTDWDRDELLRVDPSANRVVARIPMGPAPAGVAARGASVWVTDYWDGTVRRVDTETNRVTDRLGGMKHPTQVAASPNRVLVLDVGSGSIVLIPIRDSIDRRGHESRSAWVLWVLVAGAALGSAAFAVGRRTRSRRPLGPSDSSSLEHDQ